MYRLGVSTLTHVYIAAIAIILAFYAAMILTFRPAGFGQSLLLLSLLATTGVQLAVERGNFDLLIAALLCLTGALLARADRRASLAGALVLSLTTMLKLYTGLACALAWLVARGSWRWMLPVSIASTLLAITVVGPRELLILAQGAPEDATRFSAGAR